MDFEGITYCSFPKSKSLLQITIEDLKKIHFSRQKAEYILGLAKQFTSGKTTRSSIENLPGEEKYRGLTNLTGVGEWTANYVLMKTFRNPDSIPFGDIGIYQALENYKLLSNRKDR